MKTAMKFQNKSPEEIVRRYRRNVRLKQGLVILALLAYTAFAIREIWWNDVSFLGLLLGELLVFLALTPVGVWIAWDFLALNAILNINCDPVTYAQVMHLLGQKRNRKRSAITIQINEAIGDMWTGRFSEALSLVKSLPELNAGDQISVLYIRFNRRYILSKNNRKGNRTMTEQRMKEACKEYARCQQNILSSSAERRMAELDAEAAKAGLRFHMTNEAGYMNPHFIGEPKYELVAISKSKMNTSELRELAVNLGADRKKLYGTSRQSILLIISQLEKEARAAV